MKLRGVPLITIIFIVFSIFSVFLSETFWLASGSGTVEAVPNNPKKQIESQLLNTSLERLSLNSRSISKVTFSSISKKNKTLVNFWASWCAPCIEELPSLEFLTRKIRERNLPISVVAVSADETPEAVWSLFQTLPFRPTFEILLDRKGAWVRNWGTEKFPETYLIDSDGTILFKWIGPQDWTSPGLLQKIIQP